MLEYGKMATKLELASAKFIEIRVSRRKCEPFTC